MFIWKFLTLLVISLRGGTLKKRTFRKGTLVYRPEADQFPVYAIVEQHDDKCSLALPWRPAEAILQEVAVDDLELVFSRRTA